MRAGRDTSGRVLGALRFSGLSNAVTKALGEKVPQGHREKMSRPPRRVPRPAAARVWSPVKTRLAAGSRVPSLTRAASDSVQHHGFHAGKGRNTVRVDDGIINYYNFSEKPRGDISQEH